MYQPYPKHVRVGEILENVEITEVSRRGDGIHRMVDHLVIFVAGTKIGDKVSIKITRVGDTSAEGVKI